MFNIVKRIILTTIKHLIFECMIEKLFEIEENRHKYQSVMHVH